MRIVSGEFKSRSLKTLKGDNTRPTSDKIRGAIFDSITFDSNYGIFLDLFSGSGAMGIEAISRGYDFSYLNDKNKAAINIIKSNVKEIGISNKVKIFNLDYKKMLEVLDEKMDVIFIDPPYDKFDIDELLKLIIEYDLLSDDGIIIIEGSKELQAKNEIESLSLYKEKDYKSTKLMYYRKD